MAWASGGSREAMVVFGRAMRVYRAAGKSGQQYRAEPLANRADFDA